VAAQSDYQRAAGTIPSWVVEVGDAGGPGTLSLQEVLRIAHASSVPVLVDAAGRVHPLEQFHSYTRDGADLVAFGAKYLGALNASGILCGRKDLVAAAACHGFMGFETVAYGKSFGRPLKLDRQTIVAAVVEAL